jgi:hypothetical protein
LIRWRTLEGDAMEWWGWILLALVAGFLLWRQSKAKEQAVVATETLTNDNRLYQHIKAGLREVDWQNRTQPLKHYGDGELILENAHTAAYHVDHFAETRIGFYFKDLNEYGLYGFFAGNGDETVESYYRTDSTFKKEGRLLYDDL